MAKRKRAVKRKKKAKAKLTTKLVRLSFGVAPQCPHCGEHILIDLQKAPDEFEVCTWEEGPERKAARKARKKK